MTNAKIIEKLDELQIREGKTYDAEKISAMGAEMLDLIPQIRTAIIKAEEAREALKKTNVGDFRNPLIPMSGRLVRERMDVNKQWREQIAEILKNWDV